MMHVSRRPTDAEFSNFPVWNQRACVARERLVGEWEKAGRPLKWKARIEADVYREFREVFLYEAFYLKCAYCECKIGHASAVQVEHYRPKGCLTDEQDG